MAEQGLGKQILTELHFRNNNWILIKWNVLPLLSVVVKGISFVARPPGSLPSSTC